MPPTLSCAFATSPATPDHVVAAEALGYEAAWLYDSPALYPDVWATLALAASRTSTIKLGPGVLVPSLRHPMVNAAAIGQLALLAPGRVQVAVGAGFTGRMTLGQRSLPWAVVREYVQVLQALLAGETAQWEGASIRMMHPDGFASARPLKLPLLLGADGPKGDAAARDLADGIFTTSPRPGFDRCAVLTFGTVLAEGEDPGSERVLDAAGHAGSVILHALYERRPEVLAAIPGAKEWSDALDAEIPPGERHLTLHEGHLVHTASRDTALVTGQFLTTFGAARTEAGWVDRLRELAEAGATEVAYQPAGADIPGELARFAEVFSAAGR
ncbi:MAG TPA: LLM class flavin-dependent oxidoreductase [Acidimicrobiales bacterium]